MKLFSESVTLRTTFSFAIARWAYPGHENVIVRIRDADGVEGLGEAAPNRYYGESVDTVIAAFARFAPLLERAEYWSLEAIDAELATTLRGNMSARAAVSSALHDLFGKRVGLPVHRLWGLDPAAAPLSSFTIGIAADDDGLRERVQAAADYPVLKIKLGTDRDQAIVRTIRDAAPGKRLRVDANAAWQPKHAVYMAAWLADLGVEMLEQPVAAHDVEGLRFVRERSPIPVVADEACLVATDIPRLAGACDGINIKLAKCGSLREAVRMISVARAHGLSVMAGCMIETSIGITAAAQLAPLLDDADLDGAALLAHDPYSGVSIAGGKVTFPDAPGLGVRPAEELIA